MSGTNVHAIVEQAPRQLRPRTLRQRTSSDRDGATAVPAVVHLGRRTAPHRRPAGRLGRSARATMALPDLAYTLARRRGHRPVRTAVIAQQPTGARSRRCARSPTATLRIRPRSGRTTEDRCGCSPGRVRSGQRWARELLATEPVFAATVAQVEPLIARESGFSVTEAMTAPETVTGIDRIQPTLFTMQVALAATMRSYGVQPGRGHRAFARRGRGSRRRGSAVAGRRGARHLPPLAADVPHRRCRRDGVGGTACPASAFGADGSRRQRRRGGGGGLAAVHRHRRRHRRRFANWSRRGSSAT